ncbi:MAG: hypothetical protein U1F77_02500 [Kiritimatiellia bacterium]
MRRNLRPEFRRSRAPAGHACRDHPNLVQVIDAGEYDGMVYTVMEYVPGSSVADLLAVRKIFDETDTLAIATDLAAALDSCWRHHRMIHSDIKPGRQYDPLQRHDQAGGHGAGQPRRHGRQPGGRA